MVYVTDNYEMPDESVPPDSLLGERVRQYRVTVTGNRLRAEPVRAFGDTSGPGVLKVVESIAIDLPNQRLLIAEELETGSHIKVYTPEGKFTGQIIGRGLFPQPGGGHHPLRVRRHGRVLGNHRSGHDGQHLSRLRPHDAPPGGLFPGRQHPQHRRDRPDAARFGNFPSGAFYAVHNDGNVAAFSWAAIADALRLRKDCDLPAGAAEPAS